MSLGYSAPASLGEALDFLAERGSDSIVLAGGMSLVPLLKKGLHAHKCIVNIKGIGDALVRALERSRDRLRIGALVRHRDIETSAMVAGCMPTLQALEENLASLQIRNHGTLAGNLCAAAPWSDPPCLMAALDARLLLASRRGTREVAAPDWILEPGVTTRQADELLVQLDIALPARDEGVGHARLAARPGFAPPLVCAASRIRLAENGTISVARVFVGAVGPRPQRMDGIEALLVGESLTTRLSAEIDDVVSRSILCLSDERCGLPYKRQVAGVLVRRAIESAVANARAPRLPA